MKSRIFTSEAYWEIEESLNNLFKAFPNMEIVNLQYNTTAQGEHLSRTNHSVIIVFKPN